MQKKFKIGDRVQDPDSHRVGSIVYIYREPELRDELVAVKFETTTRRLPSTWMMSAS
jgi:hypothetical protein